MTAALALAALSALIAFLVYIPSLSNGFVNWDDPSFIYENPMFGHFDLFWALTARTVGNWHPATILSLELDHLLWGFDPFGYHLTNVILHSLNSFLAGALSYMLCRRVVERPGRAAVAIMTAVPALLFGLHPAHVESVAWISERKDVLCAFFFLLSVLSYISYSSSVKKGRWYFLSLMFFVLALMSKPMAVTLPIVLLILDFFPLERLFQRIRWAILEKVPFLLLSAGSAIITILAQGSEGAIMPIEFYPLWMRALAALKTLGFYIMKAVYPAGLAPYYPLTGRAEFFNLTFYASAVLVAALFIISIIALKRTKTVLAALLFYIVTLLPVIGLVQVGSQAAADRYTYIPLIGPFMLIGAVMAIILERAWYKRRALFFAAFFVFLSAFIFLAGMTVRQTAFWKDSISLWNRQIAVYPGKVPHAYNLRGLAYDEQKRYREAIEDFDMAIALDPKNAYAYNNRGNARKSLGNFRQAIGDFLKAASLAPNLPEPYVNLSVAYSEIGEMELALAARQRANALGWR